MIFFLFTAMEEDFYVYAAYQELKDCVNRCAGADFQVYGCPHLFLVELPSDDPVLRYYM